MLYNIRHITTYTYNTAVPFARCVLRMFPREEPGQTVISSELRLTPEASERRDSICFFGNRVTTLTIEQPHRALSVSVTSLVDVSQHGLAGLDLSQPWEVVRRDAVEHGGLEPSSPVHFLYQSRSVPVEPGPVAYAAKSFSPGRGMLEAATELTHRIKADFVYDPKATVVSTPLAQAFENKRGVCQDFAHVMISGLRGLGLPAAYVSGYLRTIPPPGEKRLEGADATHAWVSVWCGDGLGWVGLDPTNGIMAGNDHIIVARGRDYADVSPIDGVIIGSGGQSIDVKVDVEPLGACVR
ncbi:MAG: transglutaminase family protein [Hyphomicrobiales bacterium]|nr:transglutaminase family protein [Hyphomicrobiales bacterium]